MRRQVIDGARDEAQRLVEPLGRRWKHVQAVAARAEDVCAAMELDPELLVPAAWLHDIGYAAELQETGFHPVDGARYLRRQGVDEQVVLLVAHHSCARFEASVRELADEFAEEFPRPPADYEDALCYCDMTTGPAGDPVAASDRLDEIQVRYGPGHPVTRFVDAAREEILASVARTEERMRLSGSRGSVR
jgi:putative nucleotidyltransferase with HDIG domain